ncbi:unnamed protein product [Effrenium voratum]|uniref:Uncharacterized protein n=1 Tax=Effrenium voratum TaxID=2562239 RepID=A0AA36I7T3_9DINO|nr:unnamed protein product [Effrenium voratum]
MPETEPKRLSIIPHYRIWDPKEHDDLGDLKQPRAESGGFFKGEKLPWEGKEHFLSGHAWIEEFTRAAPHVQQLLEIESSISWPGRPISPPYLVTGRVTTTVASGS